MAEADLDDIRKDLTSLDKGLWTSIAANPATAMRGTLPATAGATSAASVSDTAIVRYASAEMEAYLSPASDPSLSLRAPDPAACDAVADARQLEDASLFGRPDRSSASTRA